MKSLSLFERPLDVDAEQWDIRGVRIVFVVLGFALQHGEQTSVSRVSTAGEERTERCCREEVQIHSLSCSDYSAPIQLSYRSPVIN